MPKKPKKSNSRRAPYKNKLLLVQKKKNFGAKSVNNAVTSAAVAWNNGGQNPTETLDQGFLNWGA